MTIFLHNYAGVDDLAWQDERWQVSYDGCAFPADFVFLTTGHARKVLSESERALTQKVEAARIRNASAAAGARTLPDPQRRLERDGRAIRSPSKAWA